ncbi:MAG: restriction endonuclease subunit S [Gammaproteobacteria bacterium]|nr:restriction endonuclease subunit S [Gammaproteobacteria bacterium]
MSRKFQCKSIPSTWIEHNGRRLDCGPYMSGAAEIRELLKNHKTDMLPSLTIGHNGGIYNGPQFARNYVIDAEHGVPFLTTTFMMQGDLSHLPLLSKKDAHSRKLSFLRVEEGMTLISCSGTVGRTVYARSDMNSVWSNQDMLKIVANSNKILPGYLNTYLCTKFGVPFIVSGKYGSVITHLEPKHFADLLVPRLGKEIEKKAHDLVQEAANLLVQYQENLTAATVLFFDSVGLSDISPSEWHSWGSDLGFATKVGVKSLRALNFNPRFNRLCERIKQGSWKPLSEICLDGTLRSGPRFKRIDADPEFAYQLIGQKQIFWLRPEGRWIAKSSVGDEVLVPRGTILVAAQGTLGETELFCRSEFIAGTMLERAYSQHFLRVISNEDIMLRGALYAFMRSETAFRMLRSASTGSKLQDFHYFVLPALPIPYPPEEMRIRCDQLVIGAYAAREKAIELEDQARSLVERTIEEGSH